jgi:hypothetical protein
MNRTDDPDVYATRTDPKTGVTVEYSLPVLHEIDFVVNEGFRRIPHGGIENGGLLIGEVLTGGFRIDSFQPIECSHAFGPSFLLSNADIEKLAAQIGSQRAGQVVGWFISHSRSKLVMTEHEASLVERLFPARCLTMLVKPEKFKATEFAFLGPGDWDASGRSFVLPLVSRRNRSASPVSKSIEQPTAVSAPPQPPSPQPPIADPIPERLAPAPQTTPQQIRAQEAQPSLPPPKLQEQRRPNVAVWLMAGAAVAFACLAAYGFYRSAVPADVPLNITAHGNTFLVSWPAEMSRAASEARIRLNNGTERALAPDEKALGTVSVENVGGSLEVELTLSRWGRESHTIDHYLKTATTSVRSVSPPQASAPVAPAP